MGSTSVDTKVTEAERATPASDLSTAPQPQAEDQLHEPTPAAMTEPAQPQTPERGRLVKAKAYLGQLLNDKRVRTAGKVAGAVALVAAGALGTLIYKGRGGA